MANQAQIKTASALLRQADHTCGGIPADAASLFALATAHLPLRTRGGYSLGTGRSTCPPSWRRRRTPSWRRRCGGSGQAWRRSWRSRQCGR